MIQKLGEQASKFIAIGMIGFVVDGGVLTVLNAVFGIGLLQSRLVSFSIAVTTTWYLNRHRTFSEHKTRRAVREWAQYAALNSIGALLNLGIFFVLVQQYDEMAATPLLPLAVAASAALIFNFLVSRHFVFRQQQE